MSEKIFNENLKNLIICDAYTNEVLAVLANKPINTDVLYSDKLNIYLDYGKEASKSVNPIYKIAEDGKIYLVEEDKK